MAEDGNSSLTELARGLYFSWTGIVFLLMALISVLMLFISAKTHGTIGEFWLAIGSAILASTVYSFVQTLLTTRQFNRFLSETIQADIRSEVSKSAAQTLEILRSSRELYLPALTYPPQSSMDPTFNRDLNASLSQSTHYIFRGLSARYAVARLGLLDSPPRDVKLIAADPTKPDAVNFRARHAAGSGDEQAFNEAKKRILDEIHMSIAGAYLTRRTFDHFELCFTPFPHVDRVEICDDEIYVTRFSDSSGARSKFPPTAKYEQATSIYQMYLSDCNSLLASPYLTRLDITGSLTEEQFLSLLTDAGIEMEAPYWADMKEKFIAFQRENRDKLRP